MAQDGGVYRPIEAFSITQVKYRLTTVRLVTPNLTPAATKPPPLCWYLWMVHIPLCLGCAMAVPPNVWSPCRGWQLPYKVPTQGLQGSLSGGPSFRGKVGLLQTDGPH